MKKMNPREAVAHVLGDSYEDVADREYQRGHTHGVVLYTQGIDYYFAMAVGRNPPGRLREDFPDCKFEKLDTDTARYCLEQGQQVWVIRQQKAAVEAPPAQPTLEQRLADIDSSIQYLEAQNATGLDAVIRDGRLQELRSERQRLTGGKS